MTKLDFIVETYPISERDRGIPVVVRFGEIEKRGIISHRSLLLKDKNALLSEMVDTLKESAVNEYAEKRLDELIDTAVKRNHVDAAR